MEIYYPIIVEQDETGSYCVTAPDIVGGVTCGDTKEDAIRMAKDMIKLMLKEAPEQCSPPTSFMRMMMDYPGKPFMMVKIEL